jgi:hypothetical protein
VSSQLHALVYVQHGLAGQRFGALIYDEAMRIEQVDQLLMSYPCVYDTRQRRITAENGPARQSYRRVQVIRLMLCALDLVHTVWRMPRYRRASWPCRAVHALQIGLFE